MLVSDVVDSGFGKENGLSKTPKVDGARRLPIQPYSEWELSFVVFVVTLACEEILRLQ